jgi:predicted transcriptional regulator
VRATEVRRSGAVLPEAILLQMPKVMISLPDDLLDRIDQEVERRHSSRSALLEDAARTELGWLDPAAIDAAVARARRALEGAGAFESAALIRAERDARHAGA